MYDNSGFMLTSNLNMLSFYDRKVVAWLLVVPQSVSSFLVTVVVYSEVMMALNAYLFHTASDINGYAKKIQSDIRIDLFKL